MFYVASNRRDWTPRDFYTQGAELAEWILHWADPQDRQRMLEIGCGAGRMLMHLARHFERAQGVDISPEMIAAARCADLPDNVELTVSSGIDLAPLSEETFGFVFSFQVFQHIPDRTVIASYLAEISRVLSERGKAALQFDTRPDSRARRLALRLPDPVLPRTRRRFIRRYPVPAAWLGEQLRGAGLDVLDERSPGTGEHWLLCKRP